MSAKIKADGDTWRAELGSDGGTGGRVLLFFCTTTDQRPYRVVELEDGQMDSEAALAGASREDLETLFRASRSMGAPKGYPSYGP